MSFSLPLDQVEAPSVTSIAEQVSARARRMQHQREITEMASNSVGGLKAGGAQDRQAVDEQRDRIEQRRVLLEQRKAARAAGLSTPPAVAKALREVGGAEEEEAPGSNDRPDPRKMFVALDALNAAAGNGEPSPRLTPREAPSATPVRFSLLSLVEEGDTEEATRGQVVDASAAAAGAMAADAIGGTMSTVKGAMSTPAASGMLGRPSSLSKISPHTPTMKTPGPSRRAST